MSMPQDPTASQPALEAPTEEAALSSFVRVLGTEQAQIVWDQACTAVGIRRPGPPLSLRQLRSVAEHLSREEGFVGVMGTALRIRVDTYENLADSAWNEAGRPRREDLTA